MEEVEESSSPAISSCGLEAVGVVLGETFREDGRLTPAELEEKFLNIARIESALAGLSRPFGSRLCLLLISKSETLELKALGIANSELVNESLP